MCKANRNQTSKPTNSTQHKPPTQHLPIELRTRNFAIVTNPSCYLVTVNDSISQSRNHDRTVSKLDRSRCSAHAPFQGNSEETGLQYVIPFLPYPSYILQPYLYFGIAHHTIRKSASGDIGNALKDSAMTEYAIPYLLACLESSDNGICRLSPLLLGSRGLGSSVCFSLFLCILSGGGYLPYLHHSTGLSMCWSRNAFNKQTLLLAL